MGYPRLTDYRKHISPAEERALALRAVNRQPDPDLLAQALGLIDYEDTPTPSTGRRALPGRRMGGGKGI